MSQSKLVISYRNKKKKKTREKDSSYRKIMGKKEISGQRERERDREKGTFIRKILIIVSFCITEQ
jgi:hypothetical protein